MRSSTVIALALALLLPILVIIPVEAANPFTDARADLAELKGKFIYFTDLLIQLREAFEELDDGLRALEDAVTDYVDFGWGIDPLEILALIDEIRTEKLWALSLLEELEALKTDEILPELSDLQDLITQLTAEGKLKGRVATRVNSYLNQLLMLIGLVDADLEQLVELINDESPETCLDEKWKLNPDVDLADCLEDAAASIGAEAWEKALEEVMAAERLLDAASLKHWLIFRHRLRNIAGLVARLDRQLARAERQYARRVRGAEVAPQQELTPAGAAVTMQLKPLGHGEFRLRVESSTVTKLQVQLFALDGRLVLTEQAEGNTLEFRAADAQGRPLANGVYLYLVTAYTPDGREMRAPVQRLALLR